MATRPTIQYQDLTGPVVVTAAAVPDLAWAPHTPDQPGRARAGLSAAILAGACFFVGTSVFPIAGEVAGWGQPPSQPVLPITRGATLDTVYAAPVFPPAAITTDWLSRYPDHIPPVPRVSEFVAFFADFSVRPLGHVGWYPCYPDWIDRRVVRAVDHLAFTTGQTGSVIPFNDLRWQAQYPVAIDRRPRAAEFVAIVAPPFSVRNLGHVGWLPSYPERAPGLSRPADFPALALDPFPRPAALQTVEWLSRYPDWFSPLSRPFGGLTEPPSSVRNLGHVGWLPTFADFARLPQRIVEFPAVFAPPFSVRPLGHLGWAPAYPDQIWPRRALLTAAQHVLAWPPHATLPIPGVVSWGPRYPDRIWPRPGLGAPWQQAFVVELGPVQPLGHVGWLPAYPDQIWRIVLPAAAQQALALTFGPVNPLGHSGWGPAYPDQIWPSRGLRVDLHKTLSFDPFPIAAPPAPDRSWAPYYPDYLWPLPGLRPSAQLFTATRHTPPDVVELSWAPEYPDWVARRTLHPAAMPFLVRRFDVPFADLRVDWCASYPDWIWARVPALSRRESTLPADAEPAVSPGVWRARYPDRLPRRDLPTAEMPAYFASPMGHLILVGQQLAWVPHYPDWFVRRTLVPVGVSPTVIEPSIIATGVTCIELVDVSLTQPLLANDGLTSPALIDEILTSPALIEEEFC